MRGTEAPTQGTGPPGANLTDQPTLSPLQFPPNSYYKGLLYKPGCYVSTLLGAQRKTKKTAFAFKELTNNSVI